MIPGKSPLTPADAAGQMILLAFEGKAALPPQMQSVLARIRPAGFTLFRAFNIETPAQVRGLTEQLQQAGDAAGLPRFLIAADQEGGQLVAMGSGTTPLPGNMAMGAADSAELAHRAGEVCGRELAAMGINVNYAPVCDVNKNPKNPVIGVRSFGEDPARVAELASAVIIGMQSTGVAATAKHFPGHGDTSSDSHYGLPSVPHSLERLEQVELMPFAAAIQVGVRLVMSAHLALPAITGRSDLPATLSQQVLTGLLRQKLGFEGVIVTDAMDMHAIRQEDELGEEAAQAAIAGADLLLLTRDPADHQRVYKRLLNAAEQKTPAGQLSETAGLTAEIVQASAARVLELKQWLESFGPPPDLEVVGCAAHRAVAAEIAVGSVTLVRDRKPLLPLHGGDRKHLAVLLPRLVDLTPADTSSYLTHTLPQALRAYTAHVDEIYYAHNPDDAEIAALVEHLQHNRVSYQAVILGTVNASMQPGQAALANILQQSGIPTVVVALRLPYDLAVIPEAETYLCTYSLCEPSMQALAAVLFGAVLPRGRLPVSIPGLYPIGFGITQ